MEGHRMQWKHANERERIERTINIDGEQGELREKWNKCEITPGTRRGVPTSRLRTRAGIALSELSEDVGSGIRRRVDMLVKGLEGKSDGGKSRCSRVKSVEVSNSFRARLEEL